MDNLDLKERIIRWKEQLPLAAGLLSGSLIARVDFMRRKTIKQIYFGGK